jgi:hypothetical protein
MILTQDNEYAAVLDACVLVPMPLCDTLLRLAEDPAMYRPLWSEAILTEVATALRPLNPKILREFFSKSIILKDREFKKNQGRAP